MVVLVSSETQFIKSVHLVKAFFAQYGHQLWVLIVDAGKVENAAATKRQLNFEGIKI